MLKSSLDQTLVELTKKKQIGDIGIELEIEGTGLNKLETDPYKYWTGKPEQSLRNGWEYVSRKPVKIEDLDEALSEFTQLLKGCKKLKTSIRCSTHIHVNVLHLTQREVYNVLAFYYFVEDLLVQTQGPLRMGNLFCLRMSDAEGVVGDIEASLNPRNPQFLFLFNKGSHKYGALNLSAPGNFGSLEFRFFRPITNTSLLRMWCIELHRMINRASQVPAKKWLAMAGNLSPKEFLKNVFSAEFVDYITSGLPDWTVSEMLLQNYDNIHVMVAALDKNKKIKVPYEVIGDDLRVGTTKPISPFLMFEDAGIGNSIEAIQIDDVLVETDW